MRIKFLGDCYYCVSGVPEPNPHHAKSCVDLGLRMIRDIREVRAQRINLNIDLRIGVPSGSIMSGVIGACKWQYDIWSKDASIANRLETTPWVDTIQFHLNSNIIFYYLSNLILYAWCYVVVVSFSSLRKVHITQQTLELLEDRYFF